MLFIILWMVFFPCYTGYQVQQPTSYDEDCFDAEQGEEVEEEISFWNANDVSLSHFFLR